MFLNTLWKKRKNEGLTKSVYEARLKDSFLRSFTNRHDETHAYALSVRTKKQSTEDVRLKLEEGFSRRCKTIYLIYCDAAKAELCIASRCSPA